MRKIATRLADGRELIYFDRTSDRGTPPADTRVLPPQTAASQLRYDQATGDRVIVAGHRQARGSATAADQCPLCPSRDGSPTEIPAAEYDVVVFENRFPALTALTTDSAGWDAEATPGPGRCEVICFSSDHDATFAELKSDQVALVLDAWIDRSRHLAEIDGVAQVSCFENRGVEVGNTQAHPHGQIYAYPNVAPRTTRMLAQARRYRQAHGTNLSEDVVAHELAGGGRIVRATDEWVAFVPYAARWPYEVHIHPRRRRLDLPGLDEAQRDGFADLYLDMLQRFDRLFDSPTPYVSAWHQAPSGHPDAGELALHIELFTNRRSNERLKVLGSTELALDSFSNDVTPESAAERLRDLGG